MKTTGGKNMKKEYRAPRAERLEFDYTRVVVASGGHDKGDWGNGHGCERVVTYHGHSHGCNQ